MASSTNRDLPAGRPGHREVSRPIARALLFVLAFCLPFEAPLFSLGPFVMTSAELMLYLSIIAMVCNARRLRRRLMVESTDPLPSPRRRRRARSHSPVGLWLAVMAVSAAAAPSYRTTALKFALRTLSGGLLYFAARDLMRLSLHARRLALALLAGAVASASLTLMETVRPEWTAWWRPFRTHEFSANGLIRASGTFAFPNIAAMYWEASIPLVLAIAMGRNGNEPTRRRTLLAVLLSGFLVHGILATASRAAFGGAVLSAGTLLIFGRSRSRSNRAVRRNVLRPRIRRLFLRVHPYVRTVVAVAGALE